MVGSATVTGVTGAGQSITAAVLTDIARLEFLYEDGIVRITYGTNPQRTMELSLSGITTSTIATPGTTPVIVIS